MYWSAVMKSVLPSSPQAQFEVASPVASVPRWVPSGAKTSTPPGPVAKGPFLIDCYNDKPWRELRKPFEYS